MKFSPSEHAPDLEASSPCPTIIEPPPKGLLKRYLSSNISSRKTEYVLLLCWFTTGLLDSTIFNAYSTFVSMQTGKIRPCLI
ncbi:MAG: hypothetical protein L6R35_006203, partial [Caloplaca aegaea]